MTAMDRRWSDIAYHRMLDVRRANGALQVRFENGDQVGIEASRIVPPDVGEVQWDTLSFDPYEIRVQAAHGMVETPWSTIRLLTDPEYATFVAEEARRYARRMGARIRTLRRLRGLSSKDLAQRAGITPQSLSQIEHGHHDVTLTTLGRLLAAMGYSYDDLSPRRASVRPDAPTPV